MAVIQITSLVFMAVLLALLLPVDCHVRLWEPPGRSTMWRRGFDTDINYQDNELFCGGFANQVQQGYKCGVCGDPFNGDRHNEAGGKYASGIVTRTYKQGQIVTVEIDVTANHKGYFEFKICPTNNPKKQETQECFDRYPVLLLDSSSSKYYVPPGNAMMSVKVVLPKDLTCDFCVLQLRYHGGNNWGTDPDGRSCVGCGYQEEFYGCADIRILPDDSSQSATKEPVRVASKYTATTTKMVASSQKPTDRKSATTRRTYDPVRTTRLPANGNSSNNDGASNAAQSPVDISIDGDNLVCQGVGEHKGIDQWCQLNCQLGYCPESHCQCVKGEYMHSTKREMGCRAAGGFANVQGYDTWCRDNCALGNCPSSMCVC